jgi:cyclopropane-fatty-acyl-phospholipid synthase
MSTASLAILNGETDAACGRASVSIHAPRSRSTRPEPREAPMPSVTSTSPAATATLDALRELFEGIQHQDFVVRLWDGTRWAPDGAGEPAFTLVVKRPAALRRLLRAGSQAALAEAYLADDLDIEGDIFAVPAVARAVLQHRRHLRDRARLALRLLRVPRADGPHATAQPGDEPDDDASPGLRAPDLRGELHSMERDRVAVTHHYDLSNRFYSLFLDPRMVYSCAVFRDPAESLEAAQVRKLDLICRKLRLRQGDRLLDIGCGWGALILHAAREYGAHATGITLSEPQAAVARARIQEAGLEDRCRVQLRDYRTLEAEPFDRVASVGMFEHVGSAAAPEYFATIHRLLRPGGGYLHHAITGNERIPPSRRPTLSSRYVFPDHELIPLGRTVTLAEAAGFDVRDVENLREHYALTLRRWVAALEARHDDAVAEVGEATWRAWRMVFAGATVDFEIGRTGLAQILMVKPLADGGTDLPLGRWDWYEE